VQMIKRIARALLMGIYYEVSAVVYLGSAGEVLDVRLFDTCFGKIQPAACEEAAQVCLLTNHPEGRVALYEQDTKNIALLREMMDVPLRVFVTGEDIGVIEIRL